MITFPIIHWDFTEEINSLIKEQIFLAKRHQVSTKATRKEKNVKKPIVSKLVSLLHKFSIYHNNNIVSIVKLIACKYYFVSN